MLKSCCACARADHAEANDGSIAATQEPAPKNDTATTDMANEEVQAPDFGQVL